MTERSYVLRDASIRDNCVRYVSGLPVGDKPLQVIIKPFKRKRRAEANNYYWLLLTHISTEAFRMKVSEEYYTPEIWHEHYKKKFLGKKVVISGDIELLPESSADKSVVEFMDYTAQVEADAADMGIVVPHINQ